jgi:hypothetical protein
MLHVAMRSRRVRPLRNLALLAALSMGPVVAFACSESGGAGANLGSDKTPDGSLTSPAQEGGTPDAPSSDEDATDDGSEDAGDGSLSVLRGICEFDFWYTDGYGNGVGPAITPPATWQYLRSRGFRLVRVAMNWGNVGLPDGGDDLLPDGGFAHPHTGIQPVLQGPLDAVYLGRLEEEIGNAADAGLLVNLSLATGFRFPGEHSGYQVTQQELTDVWARLAQAFRGNPGLHAYLITNEPNGVTDSYVTTMEQAAVDAIRDAGDDRLLWVQGNAWDACAWMAIQSPWIQDPADNFAYECHDYPGTEANAQNMAFDDASVSGFLRSVQAFHDWCKGQSLRCAVGELGWPGQNSSADWQKFNSAMEGAYELFDDARMDVTYFDGYGAASASLSALSAYTASDAGVTPTVPGATHAIDQYQTQRLVIEAHPSF